jgi:hypothetical protein
MTTKSQNLFDRIRQHWFHAFAIAMIAGIILATYFVLHKEMLAIACAVTAVIAYGSGEIYNRVKARRNPGGSDEVNAAD